MISEPIRSTYYIMFGIIKQHSGVSTKNLLSDPAKIQAMGAVACFDDPVEVAWSCIKKLTR